MSWSATEFDRASTDIMEERRHLRGCRTLLGRFRHPSFWFRGDREKRTAGFGSQQSADDSAAQPGTSQLLGVVREGSTRSDAPQAIGTHEA